MQESLSDDELISLIKESGDAYYNELVRRYQIKFEILLIAMSKKLGLSRYNKDDYLLTFYLSFDICLKKYKEQKASFLRFFNVVTERKITREMLKEINSPDVLTTAVSLNEEIADGLTRLDLVKDENENIEEDYRCEQIKFTLRSATKNAAKPKNYRIIARILLLKSQGYSVKEISNMIDISEAKIRRLLVNKTSDEIRNEMLRFK